MVYTEQQQYAKSYVTFQRNPLPVFYGDTTMLLWFIFPTLQLLIKEKNKSLTSLIITLSVNEKSHMNTIFHFRRVNTHVLCVLNSQDLFPEVL